MSTCYRIRAGVVDRIDIQDGGLSLPVSKLMTHAGITALPGEEHEDWSGYTLPRIREIAEELTPWATWWCSPATDGHDTAIGLACVVQGHAWVASSLRPDKAVSTAFHEALHLAEHWLTAEERDALDNGIIAVPVLPPGDWNSYYASRKELKANAFEGWAMSYWLRGIMPRYRRGMPADERVWTSIYRGDIGLRAARRGHIPADMMPEILSRRLAARSDGEKVFDAARQAIIAIGKCLWAAGDWIADAFRPDLAAR